MASKPKAPFAAFSAIAALGLALLAGCGEKTYTYDEAAKAAALLVRDRIAPRETTARITNLVGNDARADLAAHLPAIDTFPMVVEPGRGPNLVVAEIMSSTEKSGTGRDGWLVEAANAFNESGARLKGGKRAAVAVRKIDSGTAAQFLASGKYPAAGFSPSNSLWLSMIEAAGVKVDVVSPRLVGNVAGVVMKRTAREEMAERYSAVDFKAVVDATVKGGLFMGYTNPFASSTGLNFLQTVLLSFANGAEAKALDPGAVSAFEAFQKGVPFVAMTTIQMRESVEADGSLDAFVLERQSFEGLKQRDDYEFIPFGARHDNPLAAVGGLPAEEREVLALFAAFAAGQAMQALAGEYGFNRLDEYASPYPVPSGGFLSKAQALWKEKKDSGRPVVAVFVADVSGSMDGDRIKRLREALLAGSAFIAEGNSIGLVSFSDTVTKLLPVRPFTKRQKAEFTAAAAGLQAGGSTALYDALVVAEDMVLGAAKGAAGAKPLIILLSDGEPNSGLELGDVSGIIRALKAPIYTISYAGDVEVLKELSRMNEAAALKSDESDIAYQLGSLLNAEM